MSQTLDRDRSQLWAAYWSLRALENLRLPWLRPGDTFGIASTTSTRSQPQRRRSREGT
jgi:hypothetical protein